MEPLYGCVEATGIVQCTLCQICTLGYIEARKAWFAKWWCCRLINTSPVDQRNLWCVSLVNTKHVYIHTYTIPNAEFTFLWLLLLPNISLYSLHHLNTIQCMHNWNVTGTNWNHSYKKPGARGNPAIVSNLKPRFKGESNPGYGFVFLAAFCTP